jgi:hypothetical protein
MKRLRGLIQSLHPTCQSVFMSGFWSVCLSTHLPVSLSIYTYLPTSLTVCLSAACQPV